MGIFGDAIREGWNEGRQKSRDKAKVERLTMDIRRVRNGQAPMFFSEETVRYAIAELEK